MTEIGRRKSTRLESCRASAFNREAISDYFRRLKAVMEEHNFQDHQIFNMDETGRQLSNLSVNVVGAKGQQRAQSADGKLDSYLFHSIFFFLFCIVKLQSELMLNPFLLVDQ